MHRRTTITASDLERAIDPERLLGLARELARLSASGAGRPFGPEDRQVRERVRGLMETELGLEVRVDAHSNLIGRLAGGPARAAAVLTGTCLDGAADGSPALSFAAAAEALLAIRSLSPPLRHPLELVLFAGGGPTPWGTTGIGSRGMAGLLRPADLERHAGGKTLAAAIAEAGGSPDLTDAMAPRPRRIHAFVELRIEPGSLDCCSGQIGVASAVAGLSRLCLSIGSGAGRQDALAAAAELILALERHTRAENGRATATVGRIWVDPNEVGTAPDLVSLEAEIRSDNASAGGRLMKRLEERIASLSAKRQVSIVGQETELSLPVAMSRSVSRAAREAASELGLIPVETIAAQGHSAGHLATVAEAGLIILPPAFSPLAAAGTLALTLLALDRERVPGPLAVRA